MTTAPARASTASSVTAKPQLKRGMMPGFAQPGWSAESGKPYPGAEGVAEAIEKSQEDAQIAAQARVEKARALARKRGQEAAEEEERALRKVVGRRASEVTDRRTRWLWRDRIPVGEITLLAGRGGVGKSTVATQLAAWITTGDMKGEFYGEPRNVVMGINEDDLARTVVPRLKAAGADLDRVHFINVKTLTGDDDKMTLPSDIEAVGRFVAELEAPLLILDPMSSNLKGKRNDGDEMRPLLERIRREICERNGCAILGMAHTRKGQSADIQEAVMGSSELANISRAILGVIHDPDEDDAIILSQEKNNLGRMDIESFRYRIHTFTYVGDESEIITTSRLEWLNPTQTKASDVLAERNLGGDGSSGAADWLQAWMSSPEQGGTCTRAEAIKAGRKAEFSSRSIDRAKRTLRLKSAKGFGGEATWILPPTTPSV